MSANFGVYIQTYPRDYHLSASLINSLRYFNPTLPITLIPGNGFEVSTYPIPGLDVLTQPASFTIGSQYTYDRAFWSFDGPYERFLYIDGDVLNLRNLDSLIARVLTADEPFIFVNLPTSKPSSEMLARLATSGRKVRRTFQSRRYGNLDRLERFDSKYDWFANHTFNSGLWASSRTSFPVEWFNRLREREQYFYTNSLGAAFADSDMDELFYVDQGRLSYLAYSNGVNILDLHPDGHYVWGGHAFDVSQVDLLANRSCAPFIHWAGVPRPSESLFAQFPLFYFYAKLNNGDYSFPGQRQVPGWNAWDHFAVAGRQPMRRTIKDIRWVLLPALKKMLLR